jgi:RimJ/RimL family protein N-acetyltransferase
VIRGLAKIETERLLLREWRDSDLDPFFALNSDPEVMAHFPAVLSREESDAAVGRIRNHFAERGFGLWAVEVTGREDRAGFIGFIGLTVPALEARFTPCVEIGWRLSRAHWNRGYASEGARAALRAGFLEFGLAEIVSMTTSRNRRSRRVMETIGMTHDAKEDFDHPLLAHDSPLRPHVLYRIAKTAWLRSLGEEP